MVEIERPGLGLGGSLRSGFYENYDFGAFPVGAGRQTVISLNNKNVQTGPEKFVPIISSDLKICFKLKIHDVSFYFHGSLEMECWL